MLSLRSDLRRKALAFFLMNQKARVYVRQLATELKADSTNLSRELARLAAEGFLLAQPEGRQLYYSLNQDYPHLKPVLAMLRTSVGIEPTLKQALQKIRQIESASIYGSFAKGDADSTSDIDLLVIGRPDQSQLAHELRKIEKLLRREVNYTVFAPEELRRRLATGDPFVTDLWRGNRIGLVDHGNDETANDSSRAGQAVPG